VIIFDWRQYEPEDERQPGWPPLVSTDLRERFSEHMRDMEPWLRLVGRLSEMDPDRRWEEPPWLNEFDLFLEQVPGAVERLAKPCVFISHQRMDTDKGERLACLAEHHSVACWLDVHDPTLTLVNRLPAHDPRKSVLIAAIVEIALLRCTHVIALHTSHSLSSRWVPYELGRAKARRIGSLQAAGWFQKGQTVATCGDYVQLAVMTHNENQVADWLRKVPGATPRQVPVSVDCAGCKTTPLK
jgi:hypothetical protein